MKTSPRRRPETHQLRVCVVCHTGHVHEMGVAVATPIHPALRWQSNESGGYSDEFLTCRLPADLEGLAERQLREHPAESIQQGFILIAA